MASSDFTHITTERDLVAYCERVLGSEWLAFDTEFVSENRYRPQLCLIQSATPQGLALIDTMAIRDVAPFWNLITGGVATTIAHAAREEFLFCFRATGQRPRGLFDVQLAAGFLGLEFPASLSTLVEQLLGQTLNKAETRTDWRTRPLSKRQIQYALQDVLYLQPIYTRLAGELEALKRRDWYEDEWTRRQHDWELLETESQWERLQGLSKLKPRALAIARQLYQWRDREAERQERAPRRILPDDLLVEIAKRGEAETAKLKDIRGLNHRVSDRYLPLICEQIRLALRLPDDQLPARPDKSPSIQLGLLGQFLQTGLALVCAEQKLAPSLVATSQEVRELAAWRLGLLRADQRPSLLSGWRHEVVGAWIDEMVQGKLVLRVSDPSSDHPITIARWPTAD